MRSALSSKLEIIAAHGTPCRLTLHSVDPNCPVYMTTYIVSFSILFVPVTGGELSMTSFPVLIAALCLVGDMCIIVKIMYYYIDLTGHQSRQYSHEKIIGSYKFIT